ncbi:MAG: D-alanyl-D-alanine carboxypeptidase family protein [Myxococcales bacterium]|nr:D-alanyl-D-alanine carboxypeptidase family protein [Myxococcales bacterium]MCB9568647.1 D-alanyl-D-alanine carboxypeptidase family protein [Myxococcales bacterium]MCB9705978.1 D-alanyl-D-alanine carboxypeptidase family protein [Myxococcales bacterium]
MGSNYQEKRVKVANYGTMKSSSDLLVPVPSVSSQCRLHKLAAAAMEQMAAAIARDLGIELKISSGWRPHRWKSREDYEQTLIRKYGSVKEGRKWLAYASPHETGLAMDIGVGGLAPNRKTAAAQRKTKLHDWLVDNAHEFGWHPYKQEPWHWEFPVSRSSWESGEVGADEALAFGLDDEYGDDEDDVVEDEFDDEG